MSAPKRIQRKRTKGWRMPDGVIYVGRPSKWGNEFVVDRFAKDQFRVLDWRPGLGVIGLRSESWWFKTHSEAVEKSVARYRDTLDSTIDRIGLDIGELAGHDLACWCPLDQPCHADVLLELANRETS